MIIPDINLLVYAYNADSPEHTRAKEWWEEAVNSTQTIFPESGLKILCNFTPKSRGLTPLRPVSGAEILTPPLAVKWVIY